MWLLPRIAGDIAIEQLPVFRIAVHVIPAAGILNRTATLTAAARSFDRAQNLHAVRDLEERAHRLQPIVGRVACHRHKSLEVSSFVSYASLLPMRASRPKNAGRNEHSDEYFHAEIIV